MKKLIVTALMLVSLLPAAPTIISDVLYFANDVPAANAEVTISWTNFFGGGRSYPGGQLVRTTDFAGSIVVLLEPNPIGQPYSVTIRNGAVTQNEFWNVTSSVTPLTHQQVYTNIGPTPPLGLVQLSQLAQGGATLGQAPLWNGQYYAPGTVSSAGVSSASQLLDFLVTNSSGTVQQLGCTTPPCNIQIGASVYTLLAPVTATLSGTPANGTVFWFLSANQVLTAGYNSSATLTCSSGCTVATGITAFPPDSIPLWQTSFTANVWDVITPATMDKRGVFSRSVIAAGSGVSAVYDPTTGIQTISTDPTLTPRYFSGNGAPVLTCAAGRDFYTDKTNLLLYFCDAVNTWKQAGGSATDSSYTRYMTAGTYTSFGSSVNTPTGGWVSDAATFGGCGGCNIPFQGLTMPKATGAHYAFIGVPVPTGWTGAVKLKVFYALAFNQVGVGTVLNDYTLSCQTPGTYSWPAAVSSYAWGSTVTVTTNITDHTAGGLDVPTFSGGSIPSCSAGDIMLVRIIRENAGTANAADDMKLFYFDVALPHTVQ